LLFQSASVCSSFLSLNDERLWKVSHIIIVACNVSSSEEEEEDDMEETDDDAEEEHGSVAVDMELPSARHANA